MHSNVAPTSERLIVGLIAAVQFISVLEFMIVMPLGPDFAEALGIHTSKLGLIGGAYTAAAAVAGFVSSLFIERYDRRTALAWAMFGLIMATAAAGLAFDLTTLILARILAGCFGGPATSIALAIIADTIPAERRGKAMGAVMGSFALASVLGIPAGLELANIGGWRAPFFAISLLGVFVITIAIFKIPSLTRHLSRVTTETATGFMSLFAQPMVRSSFLMTAFTMMGLFMVVPNVSAYVQGNMHFPRDRMSSLYLAGGLVSFFMMRIVGRLTDRHGVVPVSYFGTAVFVSIVFAWFVVELPGSMVMFLFVGMMGSSSFRNVPYQSLTSQIPLPHERARFMALQSSVQHIFTTCGAFLSSMMLSEGADGSLVGMNHVALVSIVLCLTLPFMLQSLQKSLRARDQQLGLQVGEKQKTASPNPVEQHAS